MKNENDNKIKVNPMTGVKRAKIDNYSKYTIFSDGTIVSNRTSNIKVCRAKMDKSKDDYVRVTIKGDDGNLL